MKKVLHGASLLIALFSTATIAADYSENDFSGFRLGGGYVNTEIDAGSANTSEGGLKIEAGYDINEVVGLTLSYESMSEAVGNINSNDNSSVVKLGVDLGYAFYSERAFLKPYAALGVVSYSEANYDNTSLYGGVGVRFQYYDIYSDLGLNGYYLDADDDSDDDYRFVQLGLTVGYKF